VEDEVVVVKTNPVNAYLTPFWEATLRPLVDDGFIAFIDGGPDAGVHLTQHPDVSSIHITGSDKTYDAIVWGGDPEGQKRRKASGERVNSRHVAAELGCVTPVFIIPGEWSDKEMAYQARAGDLCFFPPDVFHSVRVTSERMKVLIIYSPPYAENPDKVVRK
jgi:acyl-CoA reductase-like NAD-dependent aldehyde dehydrogenase